MSENKENEMTLSSIYNEIVAIQPPLPPMSDTNTTHPENPADTTVLIPDEIIIPGQYDNLAHEPEDVPEDQANKSNSPQQSEQDPVVVVQMENEVEPQAEPRSQVPSSGSDQDDFSGSQETQVPTENEMQSVQATRQLHKLRTYNNFKINYTHYNRTGDRCVLISGVIGDSTDEILKVPIPFAYPQPRPQGNAVNPIEESDNNQELSIGIDRIGRMTDYCSQDKYRIHTVDTRDSSNNVLLGYVTGQGWWKCDVSYTVEMDLDNNILNLPNPKYFFKPQGTGIMFNLCETCFMKDFLIFDEYNQQIGSMTILEDGEIEVEINSDNDSFSSVIKALLLSAALTIFELQYAPRCCGLLKVGRNGVSKGTCVIVGVLNFVFLMCMLYFYNNDWLLTYL